MQFSSHFPLRQTASGLKLMDFPFVLAQYWGYKPYREAHDPYRNTFAILDNGLHENHEPVGFHTLADILMDNPGWYGILPDYLHKAVKTWHAAIELMKRTGLDPRHWGVVLHGSDLVNIRFQHDLAINLGFGLICFPFKAARYNYLDFKLLSLKPTQRYHLLGWNMFEDIEYYDQLPGKWSMDTGKLTRFDFKTKEQVRDKPVWKTDTIDLQLVKSNLAYLRALTCKNFSIPS